MNVFLIILCCVAGLILLWFLLMYTKRQSPDFHGLATHSYAHRGLHDVEKGVPENSMMAFRKALENGYGAELDVRRTKDGELVIMHDESLLRTAGIDREVKDCTLEELRSVRLLGAENEGIPTFREVLELYHGKEPLVVEIKVCQANYAVLTNQVCQMLDEYPDQQFCIESFDPRVLLWLRRHRPEVVRGQLSLNFFRERTGYNIAVMIIMTNLLLNFLTLPDFIAYKFKHHKTLALRLCKKLWGVQEFSWTVETDEELEEARKIESIPIFESCRPTA